MQALEVHAAPAGSSHRRKTSRRTLQPPGGMLLQSNLPVTSAIFNSPMALVI